MIVSSAAPRARADRRLFDRRLFRGAAILFPLIIVLGFAPTYYLRPLFHTTPLPTRVVHLHGLLMSTWVVLFVVQVFLISSRRVRVHQRIGYSAVGLAVAIIATGVVTALHAAKYGAASPPPPGASQLGFLIVPLTDLVMFALLFGAAVYYRRIPAAHKMLMLLTALNFLPPALARMRVPALQGLGPLWFFGVPAAAALLVLGLETWHRRGVNRVFLAGALLLIASYVARLAAMNTATWLTVATWLTQFV